MNKERTLLMVEIAIMAALSFLIDLFIPSLSDAVKISVKMIPVMVLGLRRGLVPGLAGGLIWGVLQIVTGEASIVGLVQAFLEYILAFTAVGLTGLFSKPLLAAVSAKVSAVKQVTIAGLAVLLASFARDVCHCIAGIVFWGQYAPEGMSPALNSLLVNGGAFLSETITCLIVMGLLLPVYPQLFVLKRKA